jgi:hypothetical protein
VHDESEAVSQPPLARCVFAEEFRLWMCYLGRLCLGGLATWRPGHAVAHRNQLYEHIGSADTGAAADADAAVVAWGGGGGGGGGPPLGGGADRPRSGSIAAAVGGPSSGGAEDSS